MNIKFSALSFLLLCLLSACALNKTKEQVSVNAQNKRNIEAGLFKKKYSDFLVLAADARVMGRMQGRLGQKRATTKDLKEYGRMMEREQTMLLVKIEKLATEKNIALLKNLSKKRSGGYRILNNRNDGKPFDKKYMKMMRIDHERDVKEFEKATKFEDAEIKKFATEYLPMIKKHLAGVIKLQENYK